MRLNGVGWNRETNEEHDEDCDEEECLLARVKLNKEGEGGREALGIGNLRINIWDGSELELAWSSKINIFMSGISNASIFKVRDVLHWVNLLIMKNFSSIFCSTFCWDR